MKKLKLILVSFFFILININSSFSLNSNYKIISGKPVITDGDTVKINNKKFVLVELMPQKVIFLGKNKYAF